MSVLEFRSKEEMLVMLKNYKVIGGGAQGNCYFNPKTNEVYKIFIQYLDNEYNEEDKIVYNEEDIMMFSDIKNKMFIWPKDVIRINDEIVGQVSKFVKAKPLYQINPLKLSIDKFIKNIELANQDIKIISDNGVVTFDLMYNTLYGNRFYVTDTNEFGTNPGFLSDLSLLERNKINFNYELYLFLIDGYFDEFINQYNNLKKMYKTKDEDIIYFLKLLKKYLSEYLGKDINRLGEAKECLNTICDDSKYQRLI